MNKTQLVEYVAKTLGSNAAPGAVEAVLDAIARELAAGGSVSVTGFGTFDSTKTGARLGRNPQTGTPVPIPARVRPRFRPGRNLLALVNGDREVPLDGSAIKKAPKGSLTPAPVDAKAARTEELRRLAALDIASRRIAGQAGAR